MRLDCSVKGFPTQKLPALRMNQEEYRAKMQRLKWPYGLLLFGTMIPGLLLALVITDHLARSSAWERHHVFLAMLPTLFTPILAAICFMEAVDKRVGIKCDRCGLSLSSGRHVTRLLRYGGDCPRCGNPAVTNEVGSGGEGK